MSLFHFFKFVNTVFTSERCRESRSDLSIYLDRNRIEDKLPRWREMHEHVYVEFVKRDITSLEIGPAHWAFIVIGSAFYCLIEYGVTGIELHFYNRERGIKETCAGIIGNVNYVYYDDSWRTDRTFAEILMIVDSMKAKWNTSTFSTFSRNCQHFILELGRLIFPDFRFLDFVNGIRNIRWSIYEPITLDLKYRDLRD